MNLEHFLVHCQFEILTSVQDFLFSYSFLKEFKDPGIPQITEGPCSLLLRAIFWRAYLVASNGWKKSFLVPNLGNSKRILTQLMVATGVGLGNFLNFGSGLGIGWYNLRLCLRLEGRSEGLPQNCGRWNKTFLTTWCVWGRVERGGINDLSTINWYQNRTNLIFLLHLIWMLNLDTVAVPQ